MPCPDASEFRIHLDWNTANTGPVETDVRNSWVHTQAKYGPLNAQGDVGIAKDRREAMIYAIASAKARVDGRAFDISRGCQLHPGGCPGSLDGAGVQAVADYLRTKP
jgi:hypothetical protein